jgi:hypothetical protein
MRLAVGALFAAILAPAVAAAADPVLATPQTARDFMIQNVCLDAAGAKLPGRSPIDGEAGCPAQRDLNPGGRLPYHKHDHPSPDHRTAAPRGYQRHDSFPVETAGSGTVVEHNFDFGADAGHRFGVFDNGSDGGDIAILSPGAVSIGATEGGGGGFGLWVGECRDTVGADALARSWLILEYEPSRAGPLHGQTTARLNAVPAGRAQCPTRLNAALTIWRVEPFRYRAAAGQGMPIILETLISDHYGGGNRDTADHVERFYFTRELGGSRWERWQNTAGNRQFSAARIAQQAAWFAGTGRCSPAEAPPGAPMVLIDCREWTHIVPPADPQGDRPGFFIEALRTRPDAPPFFAAPPPGRK